MFSLIRNSFFVIIALALSFLLAACGDDGDTIIVVDAGSNPGTVLPLYPANGANWNDYVKDDGADIYSATDAACDPAVDTACIHGGQTLSMAVSGYSSCTGLSAYDILEMFEWRCDDSVNPVRFISDGLQQDKGLSDLIDFDSLNFRDNYLLVWGGESIVANSAPSKWWANTIVVNNDGSNGTDMNAGEIHLVTQNTNAAYVISADRVAFLVKPGVILTGSAATSEITILVQGNFIWLEGMVYATVGYNAVYHAVYLASSNFSTLNNLIANNATSYGIILSSSSNNNLSNITASGNIYGVYLNASSNNSLCNITASGNDEGVSLNYSSNNNLSNITASGNGYGVYLNASSNNSLSNITASDNGFGVLLDASSNNNNLSNITASGNANGVSLYTSSNNSLSNITASGTTFGVILSSSSNNYFTGELQVGNKYIDCFVTAGTNPGLISLTCTDSGLDGSNTYGTNSSDAILTTGVSLAGSFVDPDNADVTLRDFSLWATDTVLREVLTPIPTGDDTLTHTWSDSITTTFLRRAVELSGDGIGNDNLLCESNETCLYTPNIAAYQGHGGLVSAGTFTDGTITGVTLMKYESNGY